MEELLKLPTNIGLKDSLMTRHSEKTELRRHTNKISPKTTFVHTKRVEIYNVFREANKNRK